MIKISLKIEIFLIFSNFFKKISRKKGNQRKKANNISRGGNFMNTILKEKPLLLYDSIFKTIVANEQDTRLLDYFYLIS